MRRMRMRLSAAVAICLLSAPSAAHADDLLGCIAGPTDVHRCSVTGAPAIALAAVAAPVLVAGAAVSIAQELTHRTQERATRENVPAPPAGARRAQPNLALVPDPPDPYRAPANANAKETRRKPSAAFQFNDTATNVATAVTGAMVVGAVIATIVHDATGHASHK